MSLIGYFPTATETTGANAKTTAPITNGVPTMVTAQQSSSTGFFGWLDDLGAKVGDVAGRAVDTVADGWLDGVKNKNSSAATTPDQTPVASDNKLPTQAMGFIDENKTMLLYGGLAVVGVAALVLVFNK